MAVETTSLILRKNGSATGGGSLPAERAPYAARCSAVVARRAKKKGGGARRALLFTVRYKHQGEVWHTVQDGLDAEDARWRFERVHPGVPIVGVELAL